MYYSFKIDKNKKGRGVVNRKPKKIFNSSLNNMRILLTLI